MNLLSIQGVIDKSPRCCSYMKVMRGELIAEGIPKGVHLQSPGSYSRSEMRSILECQSSITFQSTLISNIIIQFLVHNFFKGRF